ncbi:MAG: AAA family ATPase, partial [Campylobacterota bacterium]|nr:AAA family ATPase [Campylobacterota bacterium]
PIYIFIDEYDNFVNKLLVSDIGNYKDAVTTKEALYKQFFTMLKVGTSSNNSAIRKMFFTGVSPLALYDVTSGSNIGSNISLDERFNDFVGVTKEELHQLIIHYNLEDKKELIVTRCDAWYDSYRFHKDVPHTIYNSDMILYYIYHLISSGKEPDQLIDVNVRTDYSKLKYLVYTNQKLNGNFDLLSRLLRDDQVTISELKDNFSAFEMLQSANFSSFLFALGFVTMEKYRSSINLKIPNQTIKKIIADFIENAYRDIEFNLQIQNFNHYLSDFGYDKSLEVFNYLNEQVKAQSSIRDYIEGEAFMKGFLIAYLSLNPFYEVKSEPEITKGYVDILLNPIRDEIVYGGVIEIKYIPKSKFTQSLLEQKIQEAKEQLGRYDVTQIPHLKQKEFVKVVLVYCSWELVHCEVLKENN